MKESGKKKGAIHPANEKSFYNLLSLPRRSNIPSKEPACLVAGESFPVINPLPLLFCSFLRS